MRKKVFIFLVLTIFMIGSIVIAEEQQEQPGRIHVGGLKIIPSLGLKELYDSNIYLGNDKYKKKEISDWISQIKPGVMVDFNMEGRGGFKFGYQGDFSYYNSNNNNNWQSHRAPFSLNYEAPVGLILGIENNYTKSEDPIGSAEQYGLGIKKDRWNDDFKTKIGFNFTDSFKTLAYYNYYKQDYKSEQDNSQDYYTNEFGLGLQMKVMDKTWSFLRYYYGYQTYYTDYDMSVNNQKVRVNSLNNANNKWHKVNIGLSWDGGGKLGGELNLGFQNMTYDNKIAPNGAKYSDKNTFVAATSVNYTATETTNLTFNLSRALRLSGADNNDYFSDTLIGIMLNQKLVSKLALNGGVSYSLNEYENTPRKDNNYNFNLGLNYQIQEWLNAATGYSYKRKECNKIEYDSNGFVDHQFEISLNAIY